MCRVCQVGECKLSHLFQHKKELLCRRRLVRECAESAFTDDGIKGAIGDWKTFSIPLLEGHKMGDAHLCCCLCGLLDCFSAVLNAQHLTAKTLCKRDGTPSLSRCDIQDPLLWPEMKSCAKRFGQFETTGAKRVTEQKPRHIDLLTCSA